MGRKACKQRGISKVPRCERAPPSARRCWPGCSPCRFRRNRRPASRAWWRRTPSRAWCRKGSCSRKGRSARRTAGFIFPTSVPIARLDTNGEISLFREQTNGANGLAVTGEGDLLAAEGDGKRISKRSRDGTITTVTAGSEGKPFLAPNDLILDAKGGIYFTDPGPRPVVPGRT